MTFAIVTAGMAETTPVRMEGGVPFKEDHGDHSPRSA